MLHCMFILQLAPFHLPSFERAYISLLPSRRLIAALIIGTFADPRRSFLAKNVLPPGAVSQTGSRHYFRFRDVRPERASLSESIRLNCGLRTMQKEAISGRSPSPSLRYYFRRLKSDLARCAHLSVLPPHCQRSARSDPICESGHVRHTLARNFHRKCPSNFSFRFSLYYYFVAAGAATAPHADRHRCDTLPPHGAAPQNAKSAARTAHSASTKTYLNESKHDYEEAKIVCLIRPICS